MTHVTFAPCQVPGCGAEGAYVEQGFRRCPHHWHQKLIGRRHLEVNLQAFHLMLPKLLQVARGRYALFHNGQLFGFNYTFDDAVARGYEMFGRLPIFVHIVEPMDEREVALLAG